MPARNRVLFLHWRTNAGGISRYLHQLATHLPEDGWAVTIDNQFNAAMSARPAPPTFVSPGWARLLDRVVPRPRNLGRRLALSRAVSRGDFDVLHVGSYHMIPAIAAARARGVPVVFTEHDLYFERFEPENPRFSPARKRPCLDAARGIIAVSDSTRRDFQQLFPHFTGPVVTIHHGTDIEPDPSAPAADPSQPVFVHVGERRSYKNFRAVIAALAHDPELRRRCRVHVGGKPFVEAELAQIAEAGLGDVILYRGFIPDAELPAFYRGAAALLYVSKFEGFGLPALEAMRAGTAVIAGNHSSLPEVVGDCGLLLDVTDPAAIAGAMRRVIDDPAFRADLVARGQARSRQFTWQKCAAETGAFYRTLIAERRAP